MTPNVLISRLMLCKDSFGEQHLLQFAILKQNAFRTFKRSHQALIHLQLELML